MFPSQKMLVRFESFESLFEVLNVLNVLQVLKFSICGSFETIHIL